MIGHAGHARWVVLKVDEDGCRAIDDVLVPPQPLQRALEVLIGDTCGTVHHRVDEIVERRSIRHEVIMSSLPRCLCLDEASLEFGATPRGVTLVGSGEAHLASDAATTNGVHR